MYKRQCGQDTISRFISISALPEISIHIPSKACVGEQIFFDAQSENTNSYSWYLDGELIGSTSIESWGVTLFEPGFHTVSLIGINDFGQTEIELIDIIEVIGEPVANFSFEFFDDQILITDFSEHATSYEWDFGDGSQSNLSGDQFHLFAEAGLYDVTLIVRNECGEDSITITIDANILLPTLVFFTNHDLCVPTPLIVNDQSLGDPIAHFWRLSGPDTLESIEAVPDFLITKAGSYDLYVEIANEYGNVSELFVDYLEVEDVPQAEVSLDLSNQLLSFSNQNDGEETYYWDFGDGTESNERAGVHTYTQAGEYLVQHRVSNECGDDYFEQAYSVEIPNQFGRDLVESMEVYPNPSQGDIILCLLYTSPSPRD